MAHSRAGSSAAVDMSWLVAPDSATPVYVPGCGDVIYLLWRWNTAKKFDWCCQLSQLATAIDVMAVLLTV